MCDANERRVVPVKHGHTVGLSLYDVASQRILHTRQPRQPYLIIPDRRITGPTAHLLSSSTALLPFPLVPLFLLLPLPILSVLFPPFSSPLYASQRGLLVGSHAAPPTIWNSLPSFVRTADNFTSFRSQLKTYMFVRHL